MIGGLGGPEPGRGEFPCVCGRDVLGPGPVGPWQHTGLEHPVTVTCRRCMRPLYGHAVEVPGGVLVDARVAFWVCTRPGRGGPCRQPHHALPPQDPGRRLVEGFFVSLGGQPDGTGVTYDGPEMEGL